METATYPQRRCRESVWSTLGLAYPCELPNLHVGPCASLSVQHTVQVRDAWEAENPDKVDQRVDGGDIIL